MDAVHFIIKMMLKISNSLAFCKTLLIPTHMVTFQIYIYWGKSIRVKLEIPLINVSTENRQFK